MEKLSFELVWFESFGAKSSCTLVKTTDVNMLIDPGVAAMHPSFPAPWEDKYAWEDMGRRAIRRASRRADIVVTSHYHYDHYSPDDLDIYRGKVNFVKNPNEYINDSQRRRAEEFYSNLCRELGGCGLDDVVRKRRKQKYGDPMVKLSLARNRDFGDYSQRRIQLLDKGARWFHKRVERWNSNLWIPELTFEDTKVKYPEGKRFRFGETTLRFTEPLFHGVEYPRVGWILSTVVECGGEKLIHSSDVDGPIIEDYAEWIIEEDPDVLILDGPMTYMLGYTLNQINLGRAVNNLCSIIERASTDLIIYDHHLLRDPKFRERTQKVWAIAEERGIRLTTASEYVGRKPVVLSGRSGMT